ncbi:MAG: hypothetical protein HYX35_02470 [Proteobacteria bacterium]|nr:hypothetical protein [Pseudomonadota bacterium]
MKALLTTTVTLSVGLTLGVNQAIQADADSSPSKNGPVYLEAQFNSGNTGAQNKKREELAREKATTQQLERTEQRELTHLENTERREAEQLKREEMKTQQLEKTGQQEMEQFERNKAATQESMKNAQRSGREVTPSSSSPTENPTAVSSNPADYDPAYTRQQLQNKQNAGQQLTPEESQQFQGSTNAQGSGKGVTPSSASPTENPTAASSNPADYDPEFAKQQQMEQQARQQ